jgi:bis(5'-nucleosyl)-tetraphosphatase (symmetrical)
MRTSVRTIAIGDVHGCLQELQELLGKLVYSRKDDHLVFVGDYIDRGPEPLETVRFIKNLCQSGRVTAIKGNHDHKMVEWLMRLGQELVGGRPNDMRRPPPQRLLEWFSFSREERKWLAELPVVADLGTRGDAAWLAVHAGFEDKPLLSQLPSRMMHVRWVSEKSGEQWSGQRYQRDDEDDPYGQPQGAVHWAERWARPEHVVYGHQVQSLVDPVVHHRGSNIAGDGECWGIDTGCCFGGRLTALVLETREIVQVQAKKAYGKLLGSSAS